MTSALAVSASIDAGLEIAVVVAGLALLTAILGVPRWTAPHCRRCGADIQPLLVTTHSTVGVSGTRCACGNAVDRRGGVRWRGSRRLRGLLLVALIVGGAAGGMRLWSHQRAVRGLVWHDLMPTAQLVEAIEGSRLTPNWIDPGAEHYEFARRVRLGLATEDEIRRVLDHISSVVTAPMQPLWWLALRLLPEVPHALLPHAATLVVRPPDLLGDQLVDASATWLDPDDPGREHAFTTQGAVQTHRAPYPNWRGTVTTISVGPIGVFDHAEPGHTPSPLLGALGQVFALHRISVGERVVWSSDEPDGANGVSVIVTDDDGTAVDPSTVVVPFATFPQIRLRGDDWAGAELTIELAVAVVDRMTIRAIERAAWTRRDLTAPGSGVRWWIVRWRATLVPLEATEVPTRPVETVPGTASATETGS